MVGAKIVCHDPFDADIFIKQIHEEKITNWTAVVMFPAAVVHHPEAGKKYDISSLTVVGVGGEPVPPSLAKEMEEKGIILVNNFGATEGWGHITTPKQPLETRWGIFNSKLHLNIIGQECKALDPNGNEMPYGEDGEQAVRGPNVFKGYYKAEELNRASFTPDGFFRTGDMIRIEENGDLQITGRIKDMIIRSGQNISPAAVEDVIAQHPKVSIVGVVGAPDDVRGEIVCAFIEPKKGEKLTAEEIVEFMREKKVATHKIPEIIEIRESLPMGATGKILKKTIKDDAYEIAKKEGRIKA